MNWKKITFRKNSTKLFAYKFIVYSTILQIWPEIHTDNLAAMK